MARRFNPPKRRRPPARGFANELRNIAPDIRAAVENALRESAKAVVGNLHEISPAWQGQFRERWHCGIEGKGQKVFFRQVDRLPPNPSLAAILIGNDAPYATVAMDLEPGVFIAPPKTSEKPIIRGTRQDGIRGKLVGDGENSATAPLDWYSTYMEGGGFSKAFKQGAKAGFIRPVTKK
jgi:hypothetical protein